MTVDHRNKTIDYPDGAAVYFTDGGRLGPGVWLPHVGAELHELLIGTLQQIAETGIPLTPGSATAVLAFRAIATGNVTSIAANTTNGNLAIQLAQLFQPEAAFGGIGFVVYNVAECTVQTYGGRGFPEIAPAGGPYMPVTFEAHKLLELPASGVTQGADAPPPKKKAAAKKKAPKKKGAAKKKGAKKKAARKVTVEVND